ncbi:MAG: hypothetical protein V1719_02955 [Patescibacteria group bacterium]
MEIDSKGEIFLVAITTSSGIRRSGHNSRPVDKGVAPLGGGLAKYDKMGDGLPEGMGLDDWIHAERRKGGESPIMSFYVSWDDGCIESVVGDD